jgi:hypothetical protein
MRAYNFTGRIPPVLARLPALAVLLALAAAPLAAAPPAAAYSVKGTVDWGRYEVDLEVGLDARAAGIALPSGRARAESVIRSQSPELLRLSLFPLLLDSRTDLSAAFASGEVVLEDLGALADAAVQERSRFSSDMGSFLVDYRFSLLDVMELFIRHSRANEPPRTMEYAPTRAYSGVIVYAEAPLPVRGERSVARLRPCLFPRIWDEAMGPVLERNAVDPAYLRRWGMVGYAKDADAAAIEERAGTDPFRIMARGVFGTNRTDLLISREDAVKILSNPDNRRLLMEGRIMVVVADPLEPFAF